MSPAAVAHFLDPGSFAKPKERMRMRNIVIGIVIGAILLVGGGIAAVVFGKKWAAGYVPSAVRNTWTHQVMLEGGMTISSPYALVPKAIPVPEEARSLGMSCTQYSGGERPVQIIVQAAVFPPGRRMELERMAEVSEKIFEDRMGVITEKVQQEREVLGVRALELHGTLKRYNPPRRIRTLYFMRGHIFYFVNLSLPEAAEEGDAVWKQLVEGIRVDQLSGTTAVSPRVPAAPPSSAPPSAAPPPPGGRPSVVTSSSEPGLPPGMRRRNAPPADPPGTPAPGR